jgi:hypothetical protein
VVDQRDEYAHYPVEELNTGVSRGFLNVVRSRFGAAARGGLGVDLSATYWSRNLKLLNRLITEGRNSIWAYMLKNTSRPLLLAAQKFDVIVGNPPWLSYRFIKDKIYQSEVKKLTFGYKLLASDEVKLFTQMDLSTLVMVHCEESYLRPGGTIAFVMPRSVITGAKQHRRFQARGITQVLDLLAVFPLFNVPTCVLVRQASDLHVNDVPTIRFNARLPGHQVSLATAESHLSSVNTTTQLVGKVTVAGS